MSAKQLSSFEEVEIASKLRELAGKRESLLQEYSNVYPPSTALSFTATAIYLVPIFPHYPISIAGIYASVAKNGGGAPSVGFAMGLYRAVKDSLYPRDLAREDDTGSLATHNRLVFEKLVKPDTYYTGNSSARRFAWFLDRDFTLDPRTGIYALAWQGSDTNCRWYGPTTDTTQYSGFTGPIAGLGSFPQTITVRGANAGINVPSFTLRTRKACRMIGR